MYVFIFNVCVVLSVGSGLCPRSSTECAKEKAAKAQQRAAMPLKTKVKSLCLTKHCSMKTYGEWMYSFTFLGLGTGWRCGVSFTPVSLYPRGKSPWYPSDRRLVGSRACMDYVEK
jgi:hypothetical protein